MLGRNLGAAHARPAAAERLGGRLQPSGAAPSGSCLGPAARCTLVSLPTMQRRAVRDGHYVNMPPKDTCNPFTGNTVYSAERCRHILPCRLADEDYFGERGARSAGGGAPGACQCGLFWQQRAALGLCPGIWWPAALQTARRRAQGPLLQSPAARSHCCRSWPPGGRRRVLLQLGILDICLELRRRNADLTSWE